MVLAPDEVTKWQDNTKGLPEPHRASLLTMVAAGTDTWDMFAAAPKTEGAMRRVFKDTYGLGSFTLEAVVAWAVSRGSVSGGPDEAPNSTVAKAAALAAVDAVAKG